MNCPNCEGAGVYEANNPYYGDSRYPSEPMTTEEICPYCNGEGEVDEMQDL